MTILRYCPKCNTLANHENMGMSGVREEMKRNLVKTIILLFLFLAGVFFGLKIPRSVNIDTLQALDWIAEGRASHQRVVDGIIPVTENTGSREFNQMWVDRYDQIKYLLEEIR